MVAETDNGVDAIALARDHLPDLVILDIGIPKLGGLDVIARISSLDLPLRVLVLTGQNPSHYAARCMQAGAAGFVCKEGDLGELTASVRAVLSGYSYFPSEVIRTGKRQGGMPDDSEMIERLSDRELVVLKYLANGYTNKQIASEMFISNKTVSTYKSRLLLAQLALADRAGRIRQSQRTGVKRRMAAHPGRCVAIDPHNPFSRAADPGGGWPIPGRVVVPGW